MRLIGVMLISGIISFGAGLVTSNDESATPKEVTEAVQPQIKTVSVTVPEMPDSCKRALLGGSEVVSLSLDGTTMLIELVGNEDPEKGLVILEKYQEKYELMHEQLVPYLADFKLCQQKIA